MSAQMRLDEAYEAILAGTQGRLEAARSPGGLLEGIRSVVRGDRGRAVEPPAIWIFTNRARNAHPPRTIAETWRLPLVLAATIRSEEPEQGFAEAAAWAAKASSVLVAGPRHLGIPDLVRDVVSEDFEAFDPRHRDGPLYGAWASVLVHFSIRP